MVGPEDVLKPLILFPFSWARIINLPALSRTPRAPCLAKVPAHATAAFFCLSCSRKPREGWSPGTVGGARKGKGWRTDDRHPRGIREGCCRFQSGVPPCR